MTSANEPNSQNSNRIQTLGGSTMKTKLTSEEEISDIRSTCYSNDIYHMGMLRNKWEIIILKTEG